jgi:hypothetical protein
MDQHHSGYFAWVWDTWGTSCGDLSLILSYDGTPKSPNGTNYRAHLLALVTGGTGTTPTATAMPKATATSAATVVPSSPTSTPIVAPPAVPADDGWLNPRIKAYRSTGGDASSFLTGGLTTTCYAPYPLCIPTPPSSGSPDWVAFDLSAIPTNQRQRIRLYFNDQQQNVQYDSKYGGGSCYNSYRGVPGTFTIQTNTGAGGATPPTTGWTTTNIFSNNTLSEILLHLTNTATAQWVRFSVTGLSPCEQQTYFAGQFDFYNDESPAASGAGFLGDSILLGAMGHESNSDGHASNWSQAIHNKIGGTNYPLLVDDGVGGTTAQRCTNGDIDRLLSVSPGKYMVVALGMNDAGGGNPQGLHDEMATCIQKIHAAGKVAVIPTISWTSVADRVNAIPLYNAEIQQLYTQYPGEVLAGPDFWTYFKQRPYLLDDASSSSTDVHPNQRGFEAMELQWENWFLLNVYGVPSSNLYPDPNAPTA